MSDGDAVTRADDQPDRCAYCWKLLDGTEGQRRGKQRFCSAACLQRDPGVAPIEDETVVSAEQVALW